MRYAAQSWRRDSTRWRPAPWLPVVALIAVATSLWLAVELRQSRLAAFAPAGSLVYVIDGDTVRHRGASVRLVGFDTPESGDNARCSDERARAARATARLQQLIEGAGAVTLDYVRCACPSGTVAARACNYGRSCGVLRVDGRDVGSVLIGEGLARPYHCGPTGCPPRQRWC